MNVRLPAYRYFFTAIICGGLLNITSAQSLDAPPPARHTFEIGKDDFLLDGKAIVVRTGEMHFARVPREYWRHRLQLLHAMGVNAVCAYLFWNFHEWEQGKYDWSDGADAAAFCRMAQEEGLWVVLRPGPYVCAEWDGGGLPWWLLKKPDIRLRSQDADFLAASAAWFKEVGRVLAPLQVTHGGPIILAQVENEYGSYGGDVEYVGKLKTMLTDAGFDVPLFACNPPGDLKKGARPDLFNVVNFGRDPQGAFARLRDVQPTGPLMCGEFYPGWFDTWGSPHHFGDTRRYLADLEYMLSHRASFSLYMAHGGTTFGFWTGTDRPFKPDTNSYDYDAPISENGAIGEKFKLTRELMAKHLEPGEALPDPPAPMKVMTIAPFKLTQTAKWFENLPTPVADASPRNMESYDQGRGCMVYRTELSAGPAATLSAEQVRDFAWVFVDGKEAGVMDRRARVHSVRLPARDKPAQLDVLVEAMGHVNFGKEIHDRKGMYGVVTVTGDAAAARNLKGPWQVYSMPLDPQMLGGLKWTPGDATTGPAFWRGTFDVTETFDTYLDLSNWGKGAVWINGRPLARFWNIGPTQTAYLPGPWLKAGVNEIVILDLLGPTEPSVAGLDKPVLDVLRPGLDFGHFGMAKASLHLDGVTPAIEGEFTAGGDVQVVNFSSPAVGKQVCIETLSAHDGKPFAAIAELDLLDPTGNSISHGNWTIAYADSEERSAEDGSASNAIDGQSASYWHTALKAAQPNHPHHLVLDLGQQAVTVAGLRYTPRAGAGNVTGRIKGYRIYVGDGIAR